MTDRGEGYLEDRNREHGLLRRVPRQISDREGQGRCWRVVLAKTRKFRASAKHQAPDRSDGYVIKCYLMSNF